MQAIIQAVILRNVQSEPMALSLYTPLYGRLIVQDMRRKRQWQEVVVGDICYASLSVQGTRWFLHDLESVVTYQESAGMNAFYWRSHVLDLFFHYVPLQQPSSELFSLLVHILRISSAPDIVFKLFGLHFFSLLGYHVPEDLRWYRQVLAGIEQHHAENSQDQNVAFDFGATPLHVADGVDRWLMSMVVQHDHFRYLKTQIFLNQLYSTAG
ncbi:MAG: hypothetical protein QG632_407 [Candidatus Dependentiae bacterium]|nr:hypothetical protein [Candidatus Dependentiae bacterium]